jgi:hypothetical protein
MYLVLGIKATSTLFLNSFNVLIYFSLLLEDFGGFTTLHFDIGCKAHL